MLLRPLFIFVGCLSSAAAASSADLASHRAIYDLSLVRAAPGEGVRSARGTMTYALTDQCDGYTIESNIVMELAFSSGANNQVDQRYAAWESKNGRDATFRMQIFENGALAKAYRGTVTLKEDGSGSAAYESDAITKFDLPPGTLLSTAHTLALLKSAAAGEHFLSKTVVDGSFDEGPFHVSAAIGPLRTTPAEAGKGDTGELSKGSYWPMDLAYFPLSSSKDTPDYEIAMNFLGSGVTRGMSQDFGRFSLGFQLVRVEPVAAPACK